MVWGITTPASFKATGEAFAITRKEGSSETIWEALFRMISINDHMPVMWSLFSPACLANHQAFPFRFPSLRGY